MGAVVGVVGAGFLVSMALAFGGIGRRSGGRHKRSGQESPSWLSEARQLQQERPEAQG